MIAAIDTNILLDILIPDEKHLARSKELIDRYNEKGQLIMCEIVYAELASEFPSEKELGDFLAATSIKLIASNEKSLALSGKRWKVYSKKRDKLQCPICGRKMHVHCPNCKKTVSLRQHIISDFIIAAHALVHADLLLSQDRGFYKTYFNDLEVE